MARTRSSASGVAQDKVKNDGEDVPIPATLPSFNGSLQQFGYTDATSTNATATNKASSEKSTVTRKRQAESDTRVKFGKKPKRSNSKYADPSKYAHLQGIPDSIIPNLLCLLVGHNPGVQTALDGHAYAHPSNLYWKLLHSSGLTDRRCRPEEDREMPARYSLGLTNIVARPTKDTAELSKEEQAAGTPILEEKVRKYRPESVCCVGKSIWEAIWRYRFGRNPRKDEFKYGWQHERHNLGRITSGDEKWAGARVFVATSTSGLAASLRPAEKEAIWKELGDWVNKRREERASSTT